MIVWDGTKAKYDLKLNFKGPNGSIMNFDVLWVFGQRNLLAQLAQLQLFFRNFFLENFLCNNSLYWLFQLITPLKLKFFIGFLMV